jgi:hypothetical protein
MNLTVLLTLKLRLRQMFFVCAMYLFESVVKYTDPFLEIFLNA